MATSTIRRNAKSIEVRSVIFSYSLSASGSASANLKTLIDEDLPSGARCIGIAGVDTGTSSATVVSNAYYGDDAHSLMIRNATSSSVSSRLATIYYLCI